MRSFILVIAQDFKRLLSSKIILNKTTRIDKINTIKRLARELFVRNANYEFVNFAIFDRIKYS